MSPLFWVVLAQALLLALGCVAYVNLLDRHEARKRARRSSPHTISALPRAISIPTAKRRGQGYL